MAARLKFDVRAPARIRNTRTNGLEITRGVDVLDIPIAAGASDPAVLLTALTLLGTGPTDRVNRFPQIGDLYPGTNVPVDEQRVVSVDHVTNALEAEVIYRAPTLVDLTTTNWVVTHDSQANHILTNYVANGSQATEVHYMVGAPNVVGPVGTIADEIANRVDKKVVAVSKIEITEVITVEAILTADRWNSAKAAFRAARGMINADEWGGYRRGTWLFLGPTSRTSDRGSNFAVRLTFLEALGGWYPLGVYHNKFGIHPTDSGSEQLLRASPPPYFGWYRTNGLSVFSIYGETPFTPLFSFTPNT
jgi:hypothetical protein